MRHTIPWQELQAGFPPYDEYATCRKCGHNDIHTRYVEACGDDKCSRHPEHHERYCRRCSFEWAEKPIDAAT